MWRAGSISPTAGRRDAPAPFRTSSSRACARDHRIAPQDALAWLRAQISDPLEATRWTIAGVGPEAINTWRRAGIDAREAVAWAELGFDAPSAGVHKRAGRSPAQAFGRARSDGAGPALRDPAARTVATRRRFLEVVQRRHQRVAHSYIVEQWFDDEALAWATHDIDAGEARAWKELGLSPPEARRLADQGLSAMRAAMAWWRAGIPADEVADWIGAGLNPAEAAEQRTKGVTAQRASILRGLRKRK